MGGATPTSRIPRQEPPAQEGLWCPPRATTQLHLPPHHVFRTDFLAQRLTHEDNSKHSNSRHCGSGKHVVGGKAAVRTPGAVTSQQRQAWLLSCEVMKARQDWPRPPAPQTSSLTIDGILIQHTSGGLREKGLFP